ncbi:MAG: 50S ribosomal protein L25 [Anaerolineales bacterium]|nr:50S ribosomal protein L25 [Anaerolineales bacterium]
MEKYVLEAKKREIIGKQVKALRREGLLPAVIYGSDIEPMPLTLNTNEVRQILSVTGANTLITIKIGKKEHLALVRDLQREVINRNLLHIDFQAVSMEETISTTVPVLVVGESPAVKELNALLVTSMDYLQIEAKAKDLPDTISLDVSELVQIGDNIQVKDLIISGDVNILDDSELTVVVVAAPTLMEIEPEVEEDAELLEELTDAELLEEEEAAEGEPADDVEAADED